MEKNKNFAEFHEDLKLNEEAGGSKKLDFDDKQFCDLMLPRNRGESVANGRLGLDILERCWQRLEKKRRVGGNVLRHLLRKSLLS